MIPILTSAQMREADRRAIEDLRFPGLVLMENAARGACDVLATLLGGLRDRSILVLCGSGNNGGDGLALARHARIGGATATCVFVANDPIRISADAASQRTMLASMRDVPIITWERFRSRTSGFDAVVDAMLGTGASGPLRPPMIQAVRWANRTTGLKLAIDLPTGIDADTGLAWGEAFRADATVTMAALKPGLLLNDGADHSGSLHVAHIGAPHQLYDASGLALLDRELAARNLPALRRDANKYDCGKAMVFAGSRGMTGAGAMTSEAALRSGCGLVVYAMPEAAFNSLPQPLAPEIMTMSLPSNDDGAFSINAADHIDVLLRNCSSIALGPGLSRSRETMDFVRRVVTSARAPLVLDADGLYAFNGECALLAERKCPLIITPHHGEMARLLDRERTEISADPISHARSAAQLANAIVVLKGAPTVIASPDGRAWINSAGNPGMATGGSGDVLSGIITSIVGRTDDPLGGTLAATYLHSLAGDIAAEAQTRLSMTATDIIRRLPDAFRTLTS